MRDSFLDMHDITNNMDFCMVHIWHRSGKCVVGLEMGGSDRAQTTMYVSMRGSNAQVTLLYTVHTPHVSTAPPKARSHQRQVQRQVCPMHSKPHIFMSTRTDSPRWHVQLCPLAVCSYPPRLAQQSCCKHVHCSCSSSCPTATARNGRYKQGRRGVHRDLVRTCQQKLVVSVGG